MSGKQKLTINWTHIITSLALGAILGAFALVRVSDSQTIVIAGHTKTIEKLEDSSVSVDTFNQHSIDNRREFDAILKTLDGMDTKLDRLLLK